MRAILAHLARKNEQERGICDMVPRKDANRQVQLILSSKALLFHRKDDGCPSFHWHVNTTTRSAIRNAVPHAHLHGDVHAWPGLVPHRRPVVESRGDGFIVRRSSAVLARRPCGEQCHVRARIGVDARVVSCRLRASTVPPPRPKDRSWTVETVGPLSVPRDACPGHVNSRLPFFVPVSRGGFGGGAARLTLG